MAFYFCYTLRRRKELVIFPAHLQVCSDLLLTVGSHQGSRHREMDAYFHRLPEVVRCCRLEDDRYLREAVCCCPQVVVCCLQVGADCYCQQADVHYRFPQEACRCFHSAVYRCYYHSEACCSLKVDVRSPEVFHRAGSVALREMAATARVASSRRPQVVACHATRCCWNTRDDCGNTTASNFQAKT